MKKDVYSAAFLIWINHYGRTPQGVIISKIHAECPLISQEFAWGLLNEFQEIVDVAYGICAEVAIRGGADAALLILKNKMPQLTDAALTVLWAHAKWCVSRG